MSDETVTRLTRIARGAVETLRVRSAVNPFLFAIAVVWGCGLAAVCFIHDDRVIRLAIVAVAAVPVFVFCGVGVYLARTDPGKLQSEEYQLRRQALDMIREKGSRLRVEPTSLGELLAMSPSPTAVQPSTPNDSQPGPEERS